MNQINTEGKQGRAQRRRIYRRGDLDESLRGLSGKPRKAPSTSCSRKRLDRGPSAESIRRTTGPTYGHFVRKMITSRSDKLDAPRRRGAILRQPPYSSSVHGAPTRTTSVPPCDGSNFYSRMKLTRSPETLIQSTYSPVRTKYQGESTASTLSEQGRPNGHVYLDL